MQIDTSKEYILCAAIWYKELPTPTLNAANINKGIVLCGHRHGHIIHQMVTLNNLRTVTYGERSIGDHEQGFLTSKNRFVDRKEAQVIAWKAKQGTNNLIGSELYSEDLY